jgi:hypothetical protein
MLLPRLRPTPPADASSVPPSLLWSRERFERAGVGDCETGVGGDESLGSIFGVTSGDESIVEGGILCWVPLVC